jgi:hypothetical protein
MNFKKNTDYNSPKKKPRWLKRGLILSIYLF